MLMKSSLNNDILDRINNIFTILGVASTDTSLGTFTGITITDNVSVKVALQELETKVETLDWIAQTQIT